MESESVAPRKPLSPVKPNGRQTPGTGKRGKSVLSNRLPPSPAFSDVFSSPVVGKPPPTAGKEQTAAKQKSRIPRATPSPLPAAAPAGFSGSGAKQRVEKPSRIPRPSPSGTANSVSLAVEVPEGFSAYVNPSFTDDGVNNTQTTGPSANAFAALPFPRSRLATPTALHILERVAAEESEMHPTEMQNIAKAYLRTGPQKLSPEPSRDYCIVAPKPQALAQIEQQHQQQQHQQTHPAAEAAVAVVQEVQSSGASTPGADVIIREESDPVVPSTVCSCAAPAMEHSENDESPGPVALPTAAALERGTAAAAAGGASQGFSDVILAEPVNSAGHIDVEENIDEPAVAAVAVAQLEDPLSVYGRAPLTLHALSPIADEPVPPPSRVVSPVAFNLPSSESPDSGPASTEKQEQEGGEDNGNAAPEGPASSGSFSFGMGGAPGDPTPEAVAGGLVAQDAAAAGADPQQEARRINRTGSGDSVDQPNPFASMLFHLREGGPANYASPARQGMMKRVTWEADGIHAAAAAAAAAAAVAHHAEDAGSPQSPDMCTPLCLLPEGVPQSATPELGKGDLQAWIDRRGMRGLLNSPALADLRRLWTAVREGAGARIAAERAATEADALRSELAVAREALTLLGSEHESAVAAASAGREWAEAEVSRAREAASHMMALADQIQATFAMCEQEKSSLAEELEAAMVRAEEAESLASKAAAQAAASAEQRSAAQALQQELEFTQRAAEVARREALAAKQAAEASAQELSSIRSQLEAAQEALSQQDDDSSEGGASPAANTPITSLRMQLHSVHEALAGLHATSRAQQGAARGGGGGGASPHVQRMLAMSGQGLSQAGRLLEEDTQGLVSANAQLRELVAQVTAKVEQLSPAGTPVHTRMSMAGAERRQLEMEAEKSYESISEVYNHVPGTVTVDFQELHEVLTLQARVAGEASPTAPVPGGPTCDMDVDGVVVTNIPESHVSKVRAMVSYFEDLAVGGGGGSGSGSDGSSSDYDGGGAEDEIDDHDENELLEEESSFEVNDAELAEVEAEMWASVEEDNNTAASTFLCPPGVSPAAFSRLAGALPAGIPSTPLEGGGNNAFNAPTPAAGLPSTPAGTPADGITPADQRRHLKTMDALAALRGAHAAANDASDGAQEPRIATTPEPTSPEEAVEEGASPSPYDQNTPPVSYLRQITPVDMESLRRGPGSALRGEVKARLEKLKAELHAARNKLHQVDCGLAAISTPFGGRPAGPAPSPAPSSVVSAAPSPPSARAETVVHETPAAVNAAPTPKTRHSVRFADSVKGGGDDLEQEHRPLRPGTPATVSTTNGAAAAADAPSLQQVDIPPYEMMATMNAAPTQPQLLQQPVQLHQETAEETLVMGVEAPSPAPSAVVASSWASAIPQHQEFAAAAAASPASSTPLRRLKLESESDSDSDDDVALAPGTAGSSRMAMRMGTPLNAAINGAARGTPMTHAESRFYGAASAAGGTGNGGNHHNNSTPGLSRFSSVSSSSFSPEPAALLAMRPVGRVRGRGAGAGGRRPSESEEREFRRRAAALKIHVSPYFKKRGGVAQRDPGDDHASLVL